MIVRDLGRLLAERQRMSARDLAKHFAVDETLIQSMMGVWMRQGRVRKVDVGGCAGRCCGAREETLFEWLPENQISFIQQR